MFLGKVSLNRHDLSSEKRKIDFASPLPPPLPPHGIYFIFGPHDYCRHLP